MSPCSRGAGLASPALGEHDTVPNERAGKERQAGFLAVLGPSVPGDAEADGGQNAAERRGRGGGR